MLTITLAGTSTNWSVPIYFSSPNLEFTTHYASVILFKKENRNFHEQCVPYFKTCIICQ